MSPVLVALIASLRACFRCRVELEMEVLALRHQLAVFQRNANQLHPGRQPQPDQREVIQ